MFNNIILYNMPDNPNLVYGMLRAHKTFEDLGTFTLARGLREIRRVQLAKEEQAGKGDIKGKSRARDIETGEGEEPQDEKARLLESETASRNGSVETLDTLRSSDSPLRRPHSLDDENLVSASPLMSPGGAEEPLAAFELSEKARGKMKARSSGSTDMTRSLERIAAAGIGRNGFVPTQEWVTSWQQGYEIFIGSATPIFIVLFRLPLDPVMLVISELLPKVHDLQSSLSKANTTPAIVDFLSNASLSHVLPAPPPISPRRFVVSLNMSDTKFIN